jgi:CysZ protein
MSTGNPEKSVNRGKGWIPSPLYVLHGALFLRNHPSLWKYAAAPLIISAVILSISYYLLYYFFLDWLRGAIATQWYWQIVYYAVLVVVGLFMLIMFFFVFIFAASAIAGPFNELISEKTEQLVEGTFENAGFSFIMLIKDSGRAILHSAKILAIYLSLVLVSLVLLLIPGFGPLLFSGACVLLSAYMFAYEYLGYPMDRRRFSFKEKRIFLRSRIISIIGFGLGTLAVASIPIINILLIPSAVVGGTLLFLDLTRQVRSDSPGAALKNG